MSRSLFDRYQTSQGAKALVAETANHYEVLGAAKGAVLFPVLDYLLSEASTNARQLLKLLGRRGVEIDSRWRLAFRKDLVRWRDPGRQLIRQTAFALTLDASRRKTQRGERKQHENQFRRGRCREFHRPMTLISRLQVFE